MTHTQKLISSRFFEKPLASGLSYKKECLKKLQWRFTDSTLEQEYNKAQKTGALQRLFSCQEKDVYHSALTATRQAYSIGIKNKKEYDIYRCIFCSYYHIGRRNDRSRYLRYVPVEKENGLWYAYNDIWRVRYGPFKSEYDASEFYRINEAHL